MYKYPYGDSQQLNLDWILAKLKELEAAGIGLDLEDVSNALISLTYNTSTAYRRYDYAFLNGKLYRCLSDTSGAFDPAAWQEALIGDDLAVLTRWINAIDAAAVVDVKFDTSGTNGKIQQKYHDQYHDVVEVDYTPVQNSKRPLSSNAGYELNGAISKVFNAGTDSYADCNTFKEGLFKYAPTTLNIPESGYGFVIGYIAQANSWKWQIAITTNNPVKMFARNKINNGGWSDWKRIANEDDISSLSGAINGLTANDIANNSNVTGTKVKDALNTLNGAINSLSSDDIANDSTKISGATVTAALDALRDNIKTNTAWKNVSGSYGTLQAYYYESGTATTTYDLPENYVYVLCMQYKSNRGTAIAIRWQSGEYKVWVNKLHDTWEGWKQINGSTTIGKFTLTANCWEVWGPADADVATYSVTETGFYEVWFAPVLNVSNTNARIKLWLGSTLVAEQQCGFNSGEVRLPAAISYKGNINAGTTIYLSYQSDQGASAVRLLFGDNNYVRKIG